MGQPFTLCLISEWNRKYARSGFYKKGSGDRV